MCVNIKLHSNKNSHSNLATYLQGNVFWFFGIQLCDGCRSVMCTQSFIKDYFCVLQLKYIGLNLYICRFGQLTYMEIITQKCRISLSAFCKMILMMLVLHPVYVKYLVC